MQRQTIVWRWTDPNMWTCGLNNFLKRPYSLGCWPDIALLVLLFATERLWCKTLWVVLSYVLTPCCHHILETTKDSKMCLFEGRTTCCKRKCYIAGRSLIGLAMWAQWVVSHNFCMVRRKESRIQGDDFWAIIAQTLSAKMRLTCSALPHEQFPKRRHSTYFTAPIQLQLRLSDFESMQSSMGCDSCSSHIFPSRIEAQDILLLDCNNR